MTFGHYTSYFLLLFFVIAAIKSSINVRRHIVKDVSVKRVLLYLFSAIICGILILDSFTALSIFGKPYEGVDLDFPLKGGEFGIVQGGANEVVNHHFGTSAQKYALDIVKLNSIGMRSNKFSPEKLEDFNIYGAVVYSPCDGSIEELEDRFTDMTPFLMDPENPAGNFIVIEKKDSTVAVVLAHLMKDSISVKKGDIVQRGQPIAKVGNTGNTTEPHLHIHSVRKNTGDYFFTAEGVPLSFKGRFLIRNDRVSESI